MKGKEMFEKVFDFLMTFAVKGILAIFLTLFALVPLILAFTLALIPISIISGDEIAGQLMDIASHDLVFRTAYVLVLTSLMLEEFGMPGIGKMIKRAGKKVLR